jgi:hypothetical protein
MHRLHVAATSDDLKAAVSPFVPDRRQEHGAVTPVRGQHCQQGEFGQISQIAYREIPAHAGRLRPRLLRYVVRSGLGFTLEGFSFFLEAIFIGIYAYGWDRLRPGTHFLTGIPVAVAGVAGSMFVISVNGWMNHPSTGQ